MSIQALREQRAAKAKQLHELVNKADWKRDVDGAAADVLSNEIEDLDDRIGRINASNKHLAEQALTEGVINAAERVGRDQKSEGSRVFAKWLRVGFENLAPDEMAAIRNTMSVGTNSQGGYTVATEVATQVLDALKAYGGMRSVAEVFQTAQGNPMSFPTSDGTSETGELIAESATATGADPSFGIASLSVYKYSSKIVAVPFELLQDSSVDIEAFIRQRLVTRLGRITNTHFTTGSGSGQPNGVVTAASTGKTGTTGQTSTVIYDDLVDLQHSVDPAYREPGNCRFMFADSTLKAIRKIKDSQNRPIFVPGYETGTPGGAPDTLLGSPIQINQDVAAMAANAKSILFGDFSYYKIRDVMDVQMFRFTDSAYTKLGQVGFLAWMRAGGNLIDVGGAVKAYANSAT